MFVFKDNKKSGFYIIRSRGCRNIPELQIRKSASLRHSCNSTKLPTFLEQEYCQTLFIFNSLFYVINFFYKFLLMLYLRFYACTIFRRHKIFNARKYNFSSTQGYPYFAVMHFPLSPSLKTQTASFPNL